MSEKESKKVVAKENEKEEKAEKAEFFLTRQMNKVSDGIKERTRSMNEKYVQKNIERGKKFKNGIQNDARKLMDRLSERGRKTVEKYPTLGKIEDRAKTEWKKVDERTRKTLSSLTNRANLPNKNDIERLTKAMEQLSRKVDVLAEKQ